MGLHLLQLMQYEPHLNICRVVWEWQQRQYNKPCKGNLSLVDCNNLASKNTKTKQHWYNLEAMVAKTMFPKTPQCTDAKSRVKQRCSSTAFMKSISKWWQGRQWKPRQANCRQAFQCIPNDSRYHCSQHDYPRNHFHYMVITINMIMIIHDKHYRYNHLRAQTHTANIA